MFSLIQGFYHYFFAKPESRVLILGLDGAGKTTLLEQLKSNHKLKHLTCDKIIPTVGLNLGKIEKSESEYTFWDLGGQKVLRKIWNKYFEDATCLIYVIDGTDPLKFHEAAEVLDDLTQDPSLA